ncbi:MAG: ribulose-phosphate 3-epimerase [Planctomycetes bacterium]|nr:ribulose-phosphate 3-epimerase [Planctomycetota bacterium]
MTRSPLFDELRAVCPRISVGALAADVMSLGSALTLLEQAGVKLLHFDVMDGCFCPMLTFGPPIIKAVETSLLKDVHLMIEGPEGKVDDYIAAGADILTIPVESCVHLHRVLQAIGEAKNVNDPARGIVRGVSLNPGTPLEAIASVMDEIDMVVLLAVNPGWVEQKLIPAVRGKADRLAQMIRHVGRDILICIDGGVKRANISDVAAMGADIVVTGSAVFDGGSPLENAFFMQEALTRGAEDDLI